MKNEAQPAAMLRSFAADESGATAIEYGLIAGGISIAIIVVLQTIGTNLVGIFTDVSAGFS